MHAQESGWATVASDAKGDGQLVPGTGREDHAQGPVLHDPRDFLRQSHFCVGAQVVQAKQEPRMRVALHAHTTWAHDSSQTLLRTAAPWAQLMTASLHMR